MSSFLNSTLAANTARAYKQKHKAYLQFCRKHLLRKYSEKSICFFATELAQKIHYKSLQTYIAAIKHFMTRHKSAKRIKHMTLLHSLLARIKRVLGAKANRKPRLPITPKLLKLIKQTLQTKNQHDQYMLWCASLMSFFGLMRVSEITSPSHTKFIRDSTLMMADVKLHKSHVAIHLKASKTDQYKIGTDIIIAKNSSAICPIKATRKYISHRSKKTGPFFQFANGSFLTARSFNSFIKNALPPTAKGNYSAHSFRIGAATTAASLGYPKYTIQKMGRWRSKCYKNYIKLNKSTYIALSKRLAKGKPY